MPTNSWPLWYEMDPDTSAAYEKLHMDGVPFSKGTHVVA